MQKFLYFKEAKVIFLEFDQVQAIGRITNNDLHLQIALLVGLIPQKQPNSFRIGFFLFALCSLVLLMFS